MRKFSKNRSQNFSRLILRKKCTTRNRLIVQRGGKRGRDIDGFTIFLVEKAAHPPPLSPQPDAKTSRNRSLLRAVPVNREENRAKHDSTPSMFARARTHGYVHEHTEKLNTTGGTRGSRVLRVITDPGWITRGPVILLTAPIRAPKFLHIRYERWTPRAEYVSWILTGLNYGRLITRAVIEAFATKRVAWSSHWVWP